MIPVFDLTHQYQELKSELDYAVLSVMKNGLFSLGPELGAFENEFAAYIGLGHAIGVGSGTDALTMAVQTLELSAKDEVIVPANAYPTAFGIARAGVALRLADVGEDGNLDPAKLAKAVTAHTKAVVPVHLYGNPLDMKQLRTALDTVGGAKAAIIEDAAQAHGGSMHGRKLGSFGDIGIFSFYPTKNLGAYGDGGMVMTERFAYAKRLRMLRQYGESSRYESELISGVSRLDELQAAILRVKLTYLDGWVKRRSGIAMRYFSELSGVGDIRFVSAPVSTVRQPAYHLFVIRTVKRDALRVYLEKHGIGTGIHYPLPVHLTTAFRHLKYKKGAFPVAETLSKEIVSLPIYPELKATEVDTVIDTIRKFFRKK